MVGNYCDFFFFFFLLALVYLFPLLGGDLEAVSCIPSVGPWSLVLGLQNRPCSQRNMFVCSDMSEDKRKA
jgi:hypothetical protein